MEIKKTGAVGRAGLGFFLSGSQWVYAIGLFVWVIARPITGDHADLVLWVSYLGVWLFFPLVLFWPWAVLKRRRSLAALLVIPTAMFLWFYGARFLPRVASNADANEPVTILTFNLRVDNRNTEALVATLLASEADILALQEFSGHHRRQFTQTLGARYPHQVFNASAGLAVYSRYPILADESLRTLRGFAQSVVIQVNETSFHLINAHLARVGILRFVETLNPNAVRGFSRDRECQISRIQDAIRRAGLPAIMACDCNMTDLMAVYDQLTATMGDGYKERGWGLGHTFLVPRGFEIPLGANLPAQRLDYVFHSQEINAIDARVISDASGSDHLPVWARFDLKP